VGLLRTVFKLIDDAVGGKCFECLGDVGHDVDPERDLDDELTLKRLVDTLGVVVGRRRKIPPDCFAS
jgi:hypothetical protein